MTRELKAIIDGGNGVKMTKVSQVEEELDAVADIMVENINAVINRGESIASLVDKTSNLGIDARVFRSKAKQVRFYSALLDKKLDSF
ncbi:vAMP-7, putative [Perkinsus marinus ATCC 50983]|uniref:VAMP-7, putative n=1 Tax=Perkinsus marinus (strain ATCC 50983 / TXsc) TaxID=423536 RepID=C5KE36_PERM5|nr:vAMP-7, putative [Perkinsus marinus ATCC 50983]EER17248.1 vAMP-7, putative [Perkinsus marinus ATCC 50983]|eukprot:XP_002785452.1 vAMP-7, putative [Perkinsus marinus ATCC 50983]